MIKLISLVFHCFCYFCVFLNLKPFLNLKQTFSQYREWLDVTLIKIMDRSQANSVIISCFMVMSFRLNPLLRLLSKLLRAEIFQGEASAVITHAAETL